MSEEKKARKFLNRVIEKDLSPSDVRKGLEELYPERDAATQADMTGWIVRYVRDWNKYVAKYKKTKKGEDDGS